MTTYFKAAHFTERLPGTTHYEWCGDCSSIMAANDRAGKNVHPRAASEIWAFRRAAGVPLWQNYMSDVDLERGLRNRYAMTIIRRFRIDAIWDALDPGWGAILFGKLSRFSSSTARGRHLRRGDPDYYGGHVIKGIRLDASGTLFVNDPLIPTIENGTTYNGEWWSRAELSTFLGGPYATMGRTGLLYRLREILPPPLPPELPGEEETMLYLKTTTLTMAPNTPIYQRADLQAPVLETVTQATKVTTIGRPYRGNVPDTSWWMIQWLTNKPDNSAIKTLRGVYVRSDRLT